MPLNIYIKHLSSQDNCWSIDDASETNATADNKDVYSPFLYKKKHESLHVINHQSHCPPFHLYSPGFSPAIAAATAAKTKTQNIINEHGVGESYQFTSSPSANSNGFFCVSRIFQITLSILQG